MKIINILYVLIFVLFIFIVFKSWLFSPILTAGDSWYYYSSMYGNHFLHPYAWYTYSISTGLGGQGFAFVNTYIVVAVILKIAELFNQSWENVSRMFFYISFLVLSFSTSVFFIRKLFPKNIFWILTPIIFIFNTYILMLVGGGLIITALSYALIPISFYLFIKLLELNIVNKDRIVFLIIVFSLTFFLQCIFDLRIAFVTTIAMMVYLFTSIFYRDIKLKNIIYLFFVLFITLLLSSYWLIPMIIFRIDPIQELGVAYTSAEMLKFLSFASFENAFGLMHPYWPENVFGKIGFMKAEFLFLPIIAFSSLFFIKKGKEGKVIISFVLIGLLGIFFGKGASDPFGQVYVWLFENIPGFNLFRDSFKWFMLIALSFSILIPYALYSIGDLLKMKLRNKYIPYVLFLLTLLYLVFLIRPAFLGQLNGIFKSRNIPQEYLNLNNYISTNKDFFRTLWIPNTMLFGYYSNLHPEISARDYFGIYDLDKLLKTLSSDNGQKQLELSGVKYVVVPEDTEKQIYLTDREYDDKKYQKIISELDRIPWLSKEKQFGKITVYKTQNYKDHFWCDCDAFLNYEFINPTKYKIKISNAKRGDRLIFSETFDDKWLMFHNKNKIKSERYADKFNSFKLPEGESEIEVIYSPQKLVDIGLYISIFTFVLILTLIVLIFIRKIRK